MKKFLMSVVMIGIVAFTIYYGITHNESIAVEYNGEYNTYWVCKGQTLWTIAENVASDKDTREVVYIIRQDNNLENSAVYEGQLLKIRCEY